MKSTQLICFVGLAGLIFLGVNYSWSHAAIAATISGKTCAPQLIEEAENSVADLFGEVTARPWLYCLDEPSFGLSVQHGTTRFAPLLPAIIVLGPHGQNPDVASHEYAHSELAQRTSVLLRTYRIPTWFDEGLAMQVDTRVEYSSRALETMIGTYPSTSLRLEAISSPSEFFGHGERSVLHYAFSKCVLEKAIVEMGIDTMLAIVSDVGWRSAFPSGKFQPFEAACRG